MALTTGVANSLLGIAKEVKIILLPDERNGQKIKDVSDYILSGGTKEDFIKISSDAERFEGGGETLKESEEETNTIPSGLWNDEWNAKLLIGQYGGVIKNCDSLGGWYVWNDKAWILDEVHSITALARNTVGSFHDYLHTMDDTGEKAFLKHIKSSGNEAKLKAMASVARSWPKMSVRSDDFDTDPYLLNCQNGVIDLKTGKLLPHHPDLLLTKICSTHYDQKAECPEWLRFLDTIFKGDEEIIRFIQKAAGYALTGDVSRQVFFILHGDGANGKSTFVETIYRILGDYASITPTSTLSTKQGNEIPNDVARLNGSRFVISSELERSRLLDEALIKRFTSDEPVTARFLRQEFFEFKPTDKIFLSTNYKPTIRGTDDGIWRRIRLIPFEHKFEGEERIENFAGKFLFPELPGILRWAVEGCLLIQKEGLKPPESILAATDEYKSAEDAVGAFIDEFCDVGDMYKATSLEMYDCFRENSELSMKRKEFNSCLEMRGYKKDGPGTFGKFKGRIFWNGLKLREFSDTDEDDDPRPY